MKHVSPVLLMNESPDERNYRRFVEAADEQSCHLRHLIARVCRVSAASACFVLAPRSPTRDPVVWRGRAGSWKNTKANAVALDYRSGLIMSEPVHFRPVLGRYQFAFDYTGTYRTRTYVCHGLGRFYIHATGLLFFLPSSSCCIRYAESNVSVQSHEGGNLSKASRDKRERFKTVLSQFYVRLDNFSKSPLLLSGLVKYL